MNNVYIKKEELTSWLAKYFKNDLISIDDLISCIEDLDGEIETLEERLEERQEAIDELVEEIKSK